MCWALIHKPGRASQSAPARSSFWWWRHDPARIRQSSVDSSGVTPSGNWMRLDESGKFWTNGRTSGSIARFWPNSQTVWRPGLSILPPLTGDEVRQTVRRQSAFAELTAPRGRHAPTAGKVVDSPSRVLSEPAVTMSPRELLTRSDPAQAQAAGAHFAGQDAALRASFVPSLGMATFLVFNTVYWLVMAVVRYEFSAYFNS